MTRYEEDRNKFIPAAEKFANEVAGIKPENTSEEKGKASAELLEEWNNKWIRAFKERL